MSEENVVKLDKKGFDLPLIVFSNPGIFISAVRKIMIHDKYPDFKSAFRIKKLGDALEKELRRYLKTISELKETHKGDDIEAKAIELHDTTIHIKWDKLSADELKNLTFSPAELNVVEHLADLVELA